MTAISRSALFGRLSPTALKAIAIAAGFGKMRRNPYVALVRWIDLLLQNLRNDMATLTRSCRRGITAADPVVTWKADGSGYTVNLTSAAPLWIAAGAGE